MAVTGVALGGRPRAMLEGLRRRGGGQAVRDAWDGPDAEGWARALDAVLGEAGEG